MATKLPYVNQPSAVAKILDKIRDAKTPDRFTPDYLSTVLGFKGGNPRQFIPLAKKLGFLNSDATPSKLYQSYRNPQSSKAALAQGIKNAYHEVFERNEFAGSLSKEEFKGLVVEITGLEPKDRVTQLICQTFEALRSKADFEAKLPSSSPEEASNESDSERREQPEDPGLADDVRLGLSYTINLVLPKSDDPAVFNAIFRSLRDNLLRK